MNLTIKVKLAPTEEQFEVLKTTMEHFNDACNYIGKVAFENKISNKVEIQKIVYYDVRKKFGLSAQMTVRAISKVVEAYKRDKSIQPRFKKHGAMIYDQRYLTWKALDRVSILTLKGRTIIPIVLCDYHKSRLDRIRGQADLILIKGIFYLCVVVDVSEPEEIKTTEALGIDLGIVNLAVDSDGKTFSGEGVDNIRVKNAKLRKDLQSCGTKSAKRHLKELAGKVSRFNTHTNHVISKKIVAKAKGTMRTIGLENLKGIRNQVTVRRNQRSRIHSWSFYQLKSFIEYKAKLNGVPVILVNPRGTSHICPSCGHNEKRNRPTRDNFKCVRCGYAGLADHVAAINIAARANVSLPIVSGISINQHF